MHLLQLTALAVPALLVPASARQEADTSPLREVPLQAVTLGEGFWSERLATHRAVTVPAVLDQCERSGRLQNFAIAAGRESGAHRAGAMADADVYRVLEGIAYVLGATPDAALEARADQIIDQVVAAQLPDGYLNTHGALAGAEQRWTDLRSGHELTCAGHLIEAGLAYARSTGKRVLLDAAVRSADHLASVFGPGKRLEPPAHPEIELALMRLAAETGDAAYRALAEHFLLQRGNAAGHELFGEQVQDHAPVFQQTRPVGDAARATTLYAAMADVATSSANPAWRHTIEEAWEDVVGRHMYVTGGIGARAETASFGAPYELPNEVACCETCASVGMILWGQRMGLLTRDAWYADVVERELYNGLLAGVSLSGERFSRANPLSARGEIRREPWFETACCPTNFARALPALGARLFAHDDDSIYVAHFVESSVSIPLAAGRVGLKVETAYPWDGVLRVVVTPETEGQEFDLALRAPGWCPNPLFGGINGEHGKIWSFRKGERGAWLTFKRKWKSGDVLTLELPMDPRRVRADARVAANAGRVALQRGPVVYALVAADHDGRVRVLYLPREAELTVGAYAVELGGVPMLTGRGWRVVEGSRGIAGPAVDLLAIPYALWGNREPGEMLVWIPEDPELAREGAR
jgi:DUF1680 family protein